MTNARTQGGFPNPAVGTRIRVGRGKGFRVQNGTVHLHQVCPLVCLRYRSNLILCYQETRGLRLKWAS